MWDILAGMYKGMPWVKKVKTPHFKYELFSMEESKGIQSMFRRFQSILNELRSLGIIYDNYDHIDKILRILSRKWRPQVTSLRALQNLDSMSPKELVGILKVHEPELQQDEGQK